MQLKYKEDRTIATIAIRPTALSLMLASACVCGMAASALAQGVDVSANIDAHATHPQHKPASEADAVVVWLSPLQPSSRPVAFPHHDPYKLIQKNKQFSPHLLVVPTGSSVEFPNLDPFFHNVFSLFNGKRFDLGLYEAGSTRNVRFDREGVSYIFCNIHPGMGSVILSLSTPYYAIASPTGAVTIHNVPPGSYRLTLWSQNGETTSLNAASRTVQVTSDPVNLGSIPVRLLPEPATHTNKFGEPYRPDQTHPY